MLKHRVQTCIKVMVGVVAMFATVQANEVLGIDPAVDNETIVEVVYIDIGPDETIECMAVDPGYAYLDEESNEATLLFDVFSDPPVPVPVVVSAYTFGEGGLPTQVDERIFNENDLALDGHASVELGPFSTAPIPQDQIITLNTDTGVQVVMLENTFDPDVDVTCTVFTTEFDFTGSATGYYLDATGQAVKKKVKKKVAQANKRMVKKKAVKKKAAAKRKVAKRKIRTR